MASNLLRQKQINMGEISGYIKDSFIYLDLLSGEGGIDAEYVSGLVNYYNSKSGFSNYAIVNTWSNQTIAGTKAFTSEVSGIPATNPSGLVIFNQLNSLVDGSGFITQTTLDNSGFYPSSNPNSYISSGQVNTSGFATRAAINTSGNLTGITITGASVTNLISITGLNLTTVTKNVNEIRITSSVDTSGFSSVKVTGSSAISAVNLSGIGGTTVVYDGTYIKISGAAGGGSTSVGAVTGISVTGSASISGAITFTGDRGVETILNGNEIQFRGPLTQYVAINANTGTYTFSNLNSNVDGNYTVLASIKCPGNVDQEYYIYVNGNQANGAYNSQKQIYSGASLTASQQNKPLFAVNTSFPSAEVERTDINSRIRVSSNKSNTGFYYFSEVGLAEGGTYVTALSGIYRETFFGTFMRTITGAITSLTVASQSTSGIGADSHISLYKIPVSF